MTETVVREGCQLWSLRIDYALSGQGSDVTEHSSCLFKKHLVNVSVIL